MSASTSSNPLWNMQVWISDIQYKLSYRFWILSIAPQQYEQNNVLKNTPKA